MLSQSPLDAWLRTSRGLSPFMGMFPAFLADAFKKSHHPKHPRHPRHPHAAMMGQPIDRFQYNGILYYLERFSDTTNV